MTIMEANEPFSSGLKLMIAKRGLKNLYVAEKAGFTAQELSDMLNGRRLIKACDIPKFRNTVRIFQRREKCSTILKQKEPEID